MYIKLRSSFAPLVLVLSIFILVIFAIYYFTNQANFSLESMKYVSEDYLNYQKALYYVFVYIPFEIRFNLMNIVEDYLFSSDTYKINEILMDKNYVDIYYYPCNITYVENMTKVDIKPNGYVAEYKPCVPLLPVKNYNVINPDIFGKINSIISNSLPNYKHLKFSGFTFMTDKYVLLDVSYNFTVPQKFERTFNFGNVEYPIYPYILYYNEIISYLYNQTYAFTLDILTNISNYTYYKKYIVENYTLNGGEIVVLKMEFNNSAYYVLGLYYNISIS
ncbi:MAG: hypothetical protein ACPLX8_00975 [Nanopusillaceae archaeon]